MNSDFKMADTRYRERYYFYFILLINIYKIFGYFLEFFDLKPSCNLFFSFYRVKVLRVFLVKKEPINQLNIFTFIIRIKHLLEPIDHSINLGNV